jgi:Secretion system C-terminal sorting domain
MKKITLLLSLTFMLISGYTAEAQCTITGDLNFTTQTQIDAWVPPCSQITVTGFVNVQGSTITDISKLANIFQIGSYLQLRTISASVTSISALSNITSVGGALVIRDCDGLTSIAPLAGITSLGGAITVRDNLNLTSLTGLGNFVPTPGGNITIFNNTALTDISAINYGPINGFLDITTNPALTSLGTLSSITSTAGYLKIASNATLTNIDGLSGLTSVAGNVEISGNNALTSISGLAGLTSATGSLLVRTNPLLPNLTGLDNLTSLGTSAILEVTGNTILRNFCGLNALVASGNFTTYTVSGNGYNPLVSNFPSDCQDPALSTANFDDNKVSFYPNPITGNQLTLQTKSTGEYTMYNGTGQLVKKGQLSDGENSINVSTLNSGIYLISINNDNGGTSTIKVIKK